MEEDQETSALNKVFPLLKQKQGAGPAAEACGSLLFKAINEEYKMCVERSLIRLTRAFG
jgi:hypothetical protein